MFGKAQLPHNLSVPVFYMVLMFVPCSKFVWSRIGITNAVTYNLVSFKKYTR